MKTIGRWVVLAATAALTAGPVFAAQHGEGGMRGQDQGQMGQGQMGQGMEQGQMGQMEQQQSQAQSQTVQQVQQTLKERGFDAGPSDGIMGPQTRKALREFQQQHGLEATGDLNRETMAELGVEGERGAVGAFEARPGDEEQPSQEQPLEAPPGAVEPPQQPQDGGTSPGGGI